MFCAFGFHSWSLWSKPKTKEIVERQTPLEAWKPRTVTVQERTCDDCGEHQVRRVPIDMGA